MSREARPTRVICSQCREAVRAYTDGQEIVIVLSPHDGGTLGGARHVTTLNVWICRRCAAINPFDETVRILIAQHMTRPAPSEQTSLLGEVTA